ncbi:MAG: glutamine-hydrolyzing carbamoyl-phosphate synthase small subunit [Chloroflexota bacterium]|nr:glutamine-hydrolyzing carbamoyl-phosphate synthase small subunit [Dehalococcoidia bacterium]MDW8253230.1 glutamine-hydrolyzing carbamoyl-phosphate synthase small subunit [Chloroflexota bacterium]
MADTAVPAILVLEDGTIFRGRSIGAPTSAVGEVVFNTSMFGYQEILTDPSYAGQIVLMTYPLIGNYGVNRDDIESRRIQVAGFVVREACDEPSHDRAVATLSEYLTAQNVPGIAGIDTRALTRRLRSRGVMMGALAVDEGAGTVLERLKQAQRYDTLDFVRLVTTETPYFSNDRSGPHIVIVDLGVKFNIERLLRARGCRTTVVPAATSAEDILALQPDGIVLSPGPGDPLQLDAIVREVRALLGRAPIFGICLGHQMLARALGAKTFKLKFGHRGGNHPVKDLITGKVTITAQNHGYAVDPDTLRGGAEVSQINLNDHTVEGLTHRDLPVISIQYHAEASPGPWDNRETFDRFLALVGMKR